MECGGIVPGDRSAGFQGGPHGFTHLLLFDAAGAWLLLALALVLACPVYIFYSRAFLMESMVLMFSVWFLLAFVRTMRERLLSRLMLCTVCGTGTGLIKSTTFFVWLLPAALYGA